MKLYKIKKITNTKLFDGLEVHEIQLRDIIYGLYQSKWMHTLYVEGKKPMIIHKQTVVELENELKELLK